MEQVARRKLLRMAKWGSNLGTRNLGSLIRTEIESSLQDGNGTPLVLDFSGVRVVSHSFADECLGKLAVEMGKDGFALQVKFSATLPIVHAALRYAIGTRLKEAKPPKEEPARISTGSRTWRHPSGDIKEGDLVYSENPLYRAYGLGRILKAKGDLAKVEFTPTIFSTPPLFSHTKLLSLAELRKVPTPLELAEAQAFDEPWRFDLRQMAARLLAGNKGGQLSNARTELLPHQIFTAHKVVSSPVRRFLLADEVGLGKTIEAGMIWQALYQRGQASRTLIIAPAGVTIQWQEEMLEKFGEFFEIFNRDFHTINPRIWDLKTAAIASLDALKRDDHKRKLLENRQWDLVIFDEAHRLSKKEYGDKAEPTLNFELAQDLKDHADAMLLLTATPHQGDENHSRFINLLKLLHSEIDFSDLAPDQPGLFSSKNGARPYKEFILRTPKMSVTDAEGKRVFKGRKTSTLVWAMFPEEKHFYDEVTAYIQDAYASLEKVKDHSRRLALGFVLTIFQKLAASSFEAIQGALRSRLVRLKSRKNEFSRDIPDQPSDERFSGEWEENYPLKEGNLLLRDEIETLERLLGFRVPKERKLTELFKLVQRIFSESDRKDLEKVLVFTEYRNTQKMIVAELEKKFGQGCVVQINGDMKLDERRLSQRKFREDDNVRFLVSTESGGEGINLQFCHVVINYDLPWNPMKIEQRVGRVYRYGQDKVVQAYNFRNRETIEDKIYGYLERRLETAARALAGVGESQEDIKTNLLGQLETELDYTEIYRRTLVDGWVEQTQQEIDLGVERARRAFEIATSSLFRDVSGYSFERYSQEFQTDVSLRSVEEFADHFCTTKGISMKRVGNTVKIHAPEFLRSEDLPAVFDATFDRGEAVRNPQVQFLAMGHPIMNRMLQIAGDAGSGGYLTVREIVVPGSRPRSGYQFNFILRKRISRSEGEEYLFDFQPVFIESDAGPNDGLAVQCSKVFSEAPLQTENGDVRGFHAAFDGAAEHLKKKIGNEIWDWDEDVHLLNAARVLIKG